MEAGHACDVLVTAAATYLMQRSPSIERQGVSVFEFQRKITPTRSRPPAPAAEQSRAVERVFNTALRPSQIPIWAAGEPQSDSRAKKSQSNPLWRPSSAVSAVIQRAGEVGDALEQEADLAADAAARDTVGTVGQGRAVSGGNAAVPAQVEGLHSPGWPLEPSTRARLEPHFGWDFSHVRVHTDTEAARSAEALGARAFTRGRNIVFAGGQYTPHTPESERLIAHELTHVVQQAAHSAPLVQFQRAHAPAATPTPRIDVQRYADRFVVEVNGLAVAEVQTQDEQTPLQLNVTAEGSTVQVVLHHQGGAMLAAVPPPAGVSSAFRVELREIDERPSTGRGGIPVEPGSGEAAPETMVEVTVVRPGTLPWLGGRGEREGISVTPGAVTDFEQQLQGDPSLFNGVVLDPETGEVIGYCMSRGGVSTYFDREGGTAGQTEIGVEHPLVDPIDLIPSPGGVAKGAVGIGGKLGVKFLGKKAAAKGTRLSMAAIVRMRGVSRALLRRTAREAAAEAAGMVRRITQHGLDHSFGSHAAEWFGREVPRTTHFAAWRALVERGAASRTVFAWSTGAADTIAHLSYIEGKPFVVQFFRETGELATAFIPNPDQYRAMLRLLGRAR